MGGRGGGSEGPTPRICRGPRRRRRVVGRARRRCTTARSKLRGRRDGGCAFLLSLCAGLELLGSEGWHQGGWALRGHRSGQGALQRSTRHDRCCGKAGSWPLWGQAGPGGFGCYFGYRAGRHESGPRVPSLGSGGWLAGWRGGWGEGWNRRKVGLVWRKVEAVLLLLL